MTRAQVIETLEAIASTTVLDEFWITDEQGVAYLTNVRDATGALMPFRFNPNPAVQPQASKFYALLASPIESDHVITQSAQVREIDQEIYKYVGVNGVDRKRIVQVGNALAFEEHDLQSGSYTSPVMTAVMAAFGEPDLLDFAFTDQLDEIRVVFEEILGKQIIVQAKARGALRHGRRGSRVADGGNQRPAAAHRELQPPRRDSRRVDAWRYGLQQSAITPRRRDPGRAARSRRAEFSSGWNEQGRGSTNRATRLRRRLVQVRHSRVCQHTAVRAVKPSDRRRHTAVSPIQPRIGGWLGSRASGDYGRDDPHTTRPEDAHQRGSSPVATSSF